MRPKLRGATLIQATSIDQAISKRQFTSEKQFVPAYLPLPWGKAVFEVCSALGGDSGVAFGCICTLNALDSCSLPAYEYAL